MKKRGKPKFGLTLVIVAALLLEMISGINYERIDGKNVLTLSKDIGQR